MQAFEENPVDEEEQILRLLEKKGYRGEEGRKGGKTENLRISGPKGLRL